MVVPTQLSDLKCILLGAGEGSRLRPLTEFIPKALVPVASKPTSRWIVDDLIEQKVRPENITFAVNAKQMDLFQFEFRDLKLNWMPSARPLGTAGELQQSRIQEFIGDLQGHPALIIYADDLTSINYADMLNDHQHHVADVTIACTDRVPLDYGLVYRKPFTSRVERFSEKPYMSELKQLLWTGRALFEAKLFAEFKENEDIARNVFPRLLKNPTLAMYVFQTSSIWVDVGNVNHLRLANELFSKAKVSVSPVLPDV